MASEGDQLLLAPGAVPPQAPRGFHWAVSRIIASDTGGATVWVLVKNQPLADQFTNDLRAQFQAGLLQFFRGLGSSGTIQFTGDKAHNTVVFNGTTSPWKIAWTPSANFFIVGCTAFAGVCLSTNGNYASYAAILAGTNGILSPDILLMIPVSSSVGLQMGDCQIPIDQGTPIYVYGNVANAMQLFLLPRG